MAVIAELDRRGWANKRWVTRKGVVRGGKPFTKTSLHKLLTNVTYIGKVRYKNELHDGEQPALILVGEQGTAAAAQHFITARWRACGTTW